MPKRTIIMEISPEGDMEIKTVKNGGQQCKADVNKFAKDLGLQIDEKSRKNTADLYAPVAQVNTVQVKG